MSPIELVSRQFPQFNQRQEPVANWNDEMTLYLFFKIYVYRIQHKDLVYFTEFFGNTLKCLHSSESEIGEDNEIWSRECDIGDATWNASSTTQ